VKSSLLALVAVLTLSAFGLPARAAVILNETFTDGDLAFGSDALDGNFVRQAGATHTLSVTPDAVIGGGNALAYSNQVNGTAVVGQMQSPAVLGPNVGDQIRFRFDFRMTALPPSPSSSFFRFGLYSHGGGAITDGGSETNGDSGYGDNIGAGGSAGDAGWGREAGGSDALLGGLGAGLIPTSVTLVPVDVNETSARHQIVATITRTPTGIVLMTGFDGTPIDTASDDSPITSFDEVAFRLIGTGAANYDNIVVETTPVPEPSVAALAALTVPLFARPRRRR